MNNLDEPEVARRLENYQPDETTARLEEFGKRLLDEIVERHDRLDNKGGALAGFGGAVLALLVTTVKDWRQDLDSFGIATVLIAAVLTLIGAGFGLATMAPRRFAWFSDEEWFARELLDNTEALRRYHVQVTHGVVVSYRAQAARKAWLINAATILLVTGGIFLLMAFFDALLKESIGI
jgi:hypothetical protein